MKQKIIIAIIFILSLSIYVLTLRGISGNIQASQIKNNLDQATKPLELSPERGRFILTKSLAENNSFSLSKQLADAAYPDVGYKDGRFYVYFAPGISVLALPLYFLGQRFGLEQVGSFFVINLFAAVNLVLLFLIARKIFKLPNWASLVALMIFGFASTSWSYAITLYQHHVTTFFMLSAFYAAWRYKNAQDNNWLYSLYVWFAYGASIFLDYPNVILLAPVMLFHFFTAFKVESLKIKNSFKFNFSYLFTSIVFFLLIGLHGYYNYVNFGSPTRLSGSLIGYKVVLANKIKNDAQGAKQLQDLAEKKNIQGFFTEVQFPMGLSILTASRDRGFLLYSPIFILGIIGLILALRAGTLEIFILIASVAVNFFLYSSWGDPWGGWAYGPRYLIPSMAILSLFAAYFLSQIKKIVWRIVTGVITFILFAYSSAVALLGALTTNAVPPKIEADYLHMNYNFMHNLIFFNRGQSGSFMFNTFFSKYVTLQQYFLLIWGPLFLIVFVLLFVAPWFEEKS
jgi:hypothetical protein